MTTPHPTVDPVEIACRARRPDLWDGMDEKAKEQHRREVRAEFRALEDVGFRINGPEPTREPGWYWVRTCPDYSEPDVLTAWAPDHWNGRRWWNVVPSPSVIGPRIYSPDDVVTRYPEGETK